MMRQSARLSVFLCVTLGALGGVASIAEAQHRHRRHRRHGARSSEQAAQSSAFPPDDPEQTAGMSAATSRDYAQALRIFRENYRRTHAPRSLARMGLMEAALNHGLAARTMLTVALSFAEDPWISANRDRLVERTQNLPADAEEARCQPAIEAAQQNPALSRDIFESLYRETRSARVLARLAQTEMRLERWLDAESHMRAALQESEDPWIEANLGRLNSALEEVRSHLGALTFLGDHSGAVVRLNGTPVGSLPLAQPVWALRGRVAVEVVANGRRPFSRELTVGEHNDPIEIELEMDSTAGLVASASSAPSVASMRPSPGTRELADSADPTSGAVTAFRPLRTIGITAVSTGAISLVVGAIGLALRHESATSFNGSGCELSGGAVRPNVGRSTEYCQGQLSGFQGAELMSIAGLSIGGTLAVAGAVLLLVSPRHGAATLSSRVSAILSPTYGGLAWSTEF